MNTIIIAEAGVNHNGSLDRAIELVRAASRAGADFVKFQTFKAENLVAKSAPKAEYQKTNCNDGDDSQFEMLRRLELGKDDFVRIAAECRKLGIGFMSTPFDLDSVDFLAGVGMDYWKIPSGEITNLPILRKIGSQKGKVIMSTGMCTVAEVEQAVKVVNKAGTPLHNIILLHCTTQYPAPFDSVNLHAMKVLERLGCGGVGYSDHTEGIAVPVAAVALGAKVIEKHFTLDRNLPGPDHKASLEPDELERMVREIRQVEQALGREDKSVTEAEKSNIPIARKSVVAAKFIKKGEIFTEDNLTCKRPGGGVSPMLWDDIIGKIAPADFSPDDMIFYEQP